MLLYSIAVQLVCPSVICKRNILGAAWDSSLSFGAATLRIFCICRTHGPSSYICKTEKTKLLTPRSKHTVLSRHANRWSQAKESSIWSGSHVQFLSFMYCTFESMIKMAFSGKQLWCFIRLCNNDYGKELKEKRWGEQTSKTTTTVTTSNILWSADKISPAVLRGLIYNYYNDYN